jgi:tripartite-type tricarboxylate transporter receptor subunit TctC
MLDRLTRVLADIRAAPDVRARVLDLGIEPRLLGGDPFTGFIDSDLTRWIRIQKDMGTDIT